MASACRLDSEIHRVLLVYLIPGVQLDVAAASIYGCALVVLPRIVVRQRKNLVCTPMVYDASREREHF